MTTGRINQVTCIVTPQSRDRDTTNRGPKTPESFTQFDYLQIPTVLLIQTECQHKANPVNTQLVGV